MPNPFTTAFDSNPMNEALSDLEPPDEIKMALGNFQRRMSDPEAFPELLAIANQRGGQGVVDYVNDLTQLTEAWHGRPRSL